VYQETSPEMASNMTQSNDGVAMHRNEHDSHSHSPKRRRPSWRTQISLPEDSVIAAVPDPHSALLLAHEHEGLTSRLRHRAMDDYSKEAEQEDSMKKSTSKKRDKMIAPYLAHHIPQQYNPLGGDQQDARPTADTKFCYRHRPDMLCRKQADEPTMEMLQEVRDFLFVEWNTEANLV
jgi:F-box/WD-40 domain protein MET30